MQTIFSLSMYVLNLRSIPRIVVNARQAVVAEWLRLALHGWGVLSSNPSDERRSSSSVVDCTHSRHWKQGIFLPRGFPPAPLVHSLSYPIVLVT